METQVERVNAWREQKRRAGYQPMTVWVKADVKHHIEDLAAQRRQDLGEVITAAILVFAQGRPTSRTDTVDEPTVLRWIDERLATLIPSPMPQAPTADAETAVPTLPVEPTAALLRGEYGAITQAVQHGARELRRFTVSKLAKYTHHTTHQTHQALVGLRKHGVVRKHGTVYYWVDTAAP